MTLWPKDTYSANKGSTLAHLPTLGYTNIIGRPLSLLLRQTRTQFPPTFRGPTLSKLFFSHSQGHTQFVVILQWLLIVGWEVRERRRVNDEWQSTWWRRSYCSSWAKQADILNDKEDAIITVTRRHFRDGCCLRLISRVRGHQLLPWQREDKYMYLK